MASVEWLQVVAKLHIPPHIEHHRHMKEALDALNLVEQLVEDEARVVGTTNTQSCELYGWAPDIARHIDKTGYVYFACLNPGESTIYASQDGKTSCVKANQGDVIRLWDHAEHWTQDEASRVAIFIGSFRAPADNQAIEAISMGIAALANGNYYNSPRVSSGYRQIASDECIAATSNFQSYEHMLVSDALAQNRYVIRCHCGEPAMRVDNHWPYHDDRSLCARHLATADGLSM